MTSTTQTASEYQAYVTLQSMVYAREKELRAEMRKCQRLETSLAALELVQSLEGEDSAIVGPTLHLAEGEERPCDRHRDISQGELVRCWLLQTEDISTEGSVKDTLSEEEAQQKGSTPFASCSSTQMGSGFDPLITAASASQQRVTSPLAHFRVLTLFSYMGKKVEQRFDHYIKKLCTMTQNINQLTLQTLHHQQHLFLLFLIPYLSIEMERAMFDFITEKASLKCSKVINGQEEHAVDANVDVSAILNDNFVTFHQCVLKECDGDANATVARNRSQEVYKSRLHTQQQKICQLLQNGWPFTSTARTSVSR